MPLAVLGAWLAGRVDPEIIKTVLGCGLFVVAMSFLRNPDHAQVQRMDQAIELEYGGPRAETCLRTRDGEDICYTVCNRGEGALLASVGGLFVGMISTGLGELNQFFLLKRCKVPNKVSVATSVFVVALTALAGAGGHVVRFVSAGGEVVETVLSLVVFTVPGVIIGAQMGSWVGTHVKRRTLEISLAILFMGIAALTLAEVMF